MNEMTALDQYIYEAMDMQLDEVLKQVELETLIKLYVL